MKKSKNFLRQWISKIPIVNNEWPSNLARSFNLYIMDPIKQFIHQLNGDAYKLNKAIVSKSSTLQEIPIDKTIYGQSAPQPVQQIQPPVSNQITNPPPVQPPTHIPVPSTQVNSIDEKKLEEFFGRLESVEKKIDRFFNLIEKRVVKNAKEINIRIKLNDSNESTNTEQE